MASISERVVDLGDYLREQREGAKLSVRQLATLAGVSNPYLSQIERGLRKPSAEVLQQIAKGLRISAEALYVRAGILDSEGRPDVEAAIAADPQLTDRQRRALLDIYSSFVAENHRSSPEPARPARRPSTRRTAATALAAQATAPSTPRKPRARAVKSTTALADAAAVAAVSRPPRRRRSATSGGATPRKPRQSATPPAGTPQAGTPQTTSTHHDSLSGE
ncbi:MAG: helix-turn-helix transcriptional regulator [Kineosporiaceae bacterium]|nr:helix-turn-helix transcriptional regulator [Kineosporiaceae bacterium]